jgi:heme/copper-type cytochrome/quinol oxidase subunit 3
MIQTFTIVAGFPVSFRDIWVETMILLLSSIAIGLLVWRFAKKPRPKERLLAYLTLFTGLLLSIVCAAFFIYASTSGRVFDWRW